MGDVEIDFSLTIRAPSNTQRDYAFRMVSWLYERNDPDAGYYETQVEDCQDSREMSALINAMRDDMGLED